MDILYYTIEIHSCGSYYTAISRGKFHPRVKTVGLWEDSLICIF